VCFVCVCVCACVQQKNRERKKREGEKKRECVYLRDYNFTACACVFALEKESQTNKDRHSKDEMCCYVSLVLSGPPRVNDSRLFTDFLYLLKEPRNV